jgi:hypothetical protein
MMLITVISPGNAVLDVNTAWMQETGFKSMNQQLGGHWFESNEEAEMTVWKGLQMQQRNFYCDRILKLVSKWEKHIKVLRDYAEE